MESEGAYIMEKIKSRCTEDGDCLVWNGSCATGDYPAMTFEGKSWLVRRLVGVTLGRKLDTKEAIVPKCEEPMCVSPKHLVKTRRGPKLGSNHGAAHAAKMALIQQSRSDLTPADVLEIRDSEESLDELVKRFGKSKRAIQNIRSGSSWRNVGTGVWSGLMGARA